MEIGYKVIQKSTRRSAIMYDPLTIYNKLKKTKPIRGCGPLCVFDNYLAAENFVLDRLSFGTHFIVKCHYTISIEKCIWYKDVNGKPNLSILPQGTVLADSVTCLE